MIVYARLIYRVVPDDVLKLFGQRVRELRQQKGLSQEAFAFACKLDRPYVSGIERGRRNPSLKNIARLAASLGVTMSTLLAGVDIPAPAKRRAR